MPGYSYIYPRAATGITQPKDEEIADASHQFRALGWPRLSHSMTTRGFQNNSLQTISKPTPPSRRGTIPEHFFQPQLLQTAKVEKLCDRTGDSRRDSGCDYSDRARNQERSPGTQEIRGAEGQSLECYANVTDLALYSANTHHSGKYPTHHPNQNQHTSTRHSHSHNHCHPKPNQNSHFIPGTRSDIHPRLLGNHEIDMLEQHPGARGSRQ